jgi:hypothetical protein
MFTTNLCVSLIVCSSFIIIALIISTSCVKYYSSESRRALVNLNEKYNNLSIIDSEKEKMYKSLIDNKDKECSRLTEIIKCLTEKQQNYNVNAKVNT